MLDHVSLEVSDLKKAKEFYSITLKPLGYEIFQEWDKGIGFAVNGQPDFWLKEGGKVLTPTHVAFHADRRPLVDAFYKAALSAGGRDNGAPGVRKIYHPDYYGAFILDLDGYNIEAVCYNSQA
jgi:catechol 2,3-dioxygenase-like lactoylglutathione lyase family enzyme